jgi:DNA-directed RNA polymerase subunit RPC12/RpoP
MSVECPNCGSRYLRPSRPRSFGERLDRLKFRDHLRCLDCNTRFDANTFNWEEIRYARCPICHRMDLNGWTGQSYVPPFYMQWMINFGARRYRCEYCRHNFASFRIRKEVFSFNRWKKRAQRLEEERTGEKLDPAQVEAHEGPVSPDSH